MFPHRASIFTLLCFIGAIGAACGGPEPSPTAASTATSTPTVDFAPGLPTDPFHRWTVDGVAHEYVSGIAEPRRLETGRAIPGIAVHLTDENISCTDSPIGTEGFGTKDLFASVKAEYPDAVVGTFGANEVDVVIRHRPYGNDMYVLGLADGGALMFVDTDLANRVRGWFSFKSLRGEGSQALGAFDVPFCPTATFTLTISEDVDVTGTGSVKSSDGGGWSFRNFGLNYWKAYPVGEGATVTLEATADSNSAFRGWSGACEGTGPCKVTMDADKTVVARFVRADTE